MAEPSEAVIQQLVDELSILNTDLIGQKGTLSAAASQASADAAQVAADRSAIEAIEQAVSDDAATVDQLKASVDASQVEVATNTQIASDAATTATDQAAIATDAVAQIVNPVHMQSSLSQLDEHNYPKKTLYKNGDGFIAYYPEYAVFRKDSGAWEYVTPHLRNVLTLNGTTQYAVAPKVTELNLDDPNLAFEIEWTMSSDTPGTCILAQSLSQIASEREFMLFIRGSGDIGVITGGTETASGITPAEGEVCTMKYSNGNISFSSGAVSTEYAYQIGTARESVGNLLVGARRNGDNTSVSALYQGKLRDIKIWTGGDRSAGTLTRYYRMDEGWRGDSNNVLINYATELGEDVVVNGEFNGDLSGWTIETAGDSTVVWSADGVRIQSPSGDTALLFQAIPTGNYLNTITANVISGGLANEKNTRIRSGENQFTYSSNRAYVKRMFTGTDAYVSSYSSRPAVGYGSYIGLEETSWTEEEA